MAERIISSVSMNFSMVRHTEVMLKTGAEGKLFCQNRKPREVMNASKTSSIVCPIYLMDTSHSKNESYFAKSIIIKVCSFLFEADLSVPITFRQI